MPDDRYLGMRPGDLDGKPYARYWQPEMQPLPAHAAEAILQGPLAAELGLSFEHANRLLEPGYLDIETGYARLPNGQVFVSVLTPMPGVSGEMIDWWFGWHGGEKERYKLWHPQAHMRAPSARPLSDAPDLTDRQKYVGNTSHVDEYIGNDLHHIAIAFSAPDDFHLDEQRFSDAGVSTAVCARVGLINHPIEFARLIHLIRETDEGCEMRSRFWLGDLAVRGWDRDNPFNRLLGSPAVARRAGSMAMGRDLLVHCAMEMQHLAGFLGDLYSDYHPREHV